MRCAIAASCLGILAAAGCHKNQDGLPPATEWQASADQSGDIPQAPPPGMGGGRGRNPHGVPGDPGDPSDPHAGLDISGGDPHAGLDMSGGDPHAGLDMSGGDPHAGGVDVTKLGLAAPDPDRAIDPSHRIAGTLAIAPRLKDKVASGTAVFLVVKRAGPDGAPSGPPLAVDKLTWTGSGMLFELTEEQAMVAGTDLSGDVVVTARYDQDSDALSKQPGDVTGQVKVKIPADRVQLTLDTLLP
jgi:hypothetical protein